MSTLQARMKEEVDRWGVLTRAKPRQCGFSAGGAHGDEALLARSVTPERSGGRRFRSVKTLAFGLGRLYYRHIVNRIIVSGICHDNSRYGLLK